MVKIAGVLQKTMIDCCVDTVSMQQRDAFCPSSKTGCRGIGEPDSRVGPPTRGFYTHPRNFATFQPFYPPNMRYSFANFIAAFTKPFVPKV